jgi:membrane protein involved in colicin uptake
MTPACLHILTDLLTLSATTWQQQEAEARRRDEEKSSLYRYKSHGEELKEEERDEVERRQMFPTYEQVHSGD